MKQILDKRKQTQTYANNNMQWLQGGKRNSFTPTGLNGEIPTRRSMSPVQEKTLRRFRRCWKILKMKRRG